MLDFGRVLKGLARTGVAILLVSIAARPAGATFAGTNGSIAYVDYDSDCVPACSQLAVFVDGIQRTHPTLGATAESDLDPAFSPDGTKISFARAFGGGNLNTELAVMNADGSGLHTILDSATWIGLRGANVSAATLSHPAWLSGGRRIAFAVTTVGFNTYANGGIFTVRSDGSDLQLVVQNWDTASQAIFEPSSAPIDKRIAFRCGFRIYGTRYRDDLCTVEAGSGELRRLPINLDPSYAGAQAPVLSNPNWTPDGQRLIFTANFNSSDMPKCANEYGSYEGQYKRTEIFSIRADGSALTRLTTTPVVCLSPPVQIQAATFYDRAVMSPDGRSLMAHAERRDPSSSQIGLWKLDAKGQGASFERATSNYPDGLDWQASPATLAVTVTDGHDHPLDGLRVGAERGRRESHQLPRRNVRVRERTGREVRGAGHARRRDRAARRRTGVRHPQRIR